MIFFCSINCWMLHPMILLIISLLTILTQIYFWLLLLQLLMLKHWTFGFPFSVPYSDGDPAARAQTGEFSKPMYQSVIKKRGQQRGGGPSGGRRCLSGWGLRVSTKIQEQPATSLPERLAAPRDGGQRCDGRPQEEPLWLLHLQRIWRGSPFAILLRNRGQLCLPYR